MSSVLRLGVYRERIEKYGIYNSGSKSGSGSGSGSGTRGSVGGGGTQLGYPWVPSKNFSQVGPAVLPAMANIYTNKYINMREELYFI